MYDGNEEYYGVPIMYGTNIMRLSRGYDSAPAVADIDSAYEDMVKESYTVSYIIGNETSPESTISLAESRRDCITYIGTPYISEYDIISFRNTLGHSEFTTLIAQYKEQYSDYLSKYIWVNIAGDTAGLKSASDYENEEYTASAGLERGELQNVSRMKYNFLQPKRDELYRNSINTVSKLNNYYLNGQKTLVEYATAYDRVNIRALFNKLERDIGAITRRNVFEVNSSYTRNKIISEIRPYLSYIKAGEGVQDFHAICDETNNDSTQFITVDVIIQPTYITEFVRLRFISDGEELQLQTQTRSL